MENTLAPNAVIVGSIPGPIVAMCTHKGRLYVATDRQVFSLEPNGTFQPMEVVLQFSVAG